MPSIGGSDAIVVKPALLRTLGAPRVVAISMAFWLAGCGHAGVITSGDGHNTSPGSDSGTSPPGACVQSPEMGPPPVGSTQTLPPGSVFPTDEECAARIRR